jgi:hypothetical protein
MELRSRKLLERESGCWYQMRMAWQGEEKDFTRSVSGAPDTALIDHVVAELQDIERRSGIDRTLAIGEVVLNQFFDGKPEIWRDRRRNKNNSIRRLADRKDCPFCRSALNEAVAVYVAVLEFPCVRTFGHICASHVASVLTLPDPERREMLERAQRNQWSVRELRQKVLQARGDATIRELPAAGAKTRPISALRALTKQLRDATDEVRRLELSSDVALAELKEIGEDISELGSTLVELANVALGCVRRDGDGTREGLGENLQ